MSSFASPSVSDGLMWAKTIPFTNQPETHEMGLTFEPGPIFNYSEYYDNLSAEEKALFMAPNELLTGDTVAINAGVRGVGSRYVVWLAADLHHNPVPKPETHLVGQTVGVKRRIEATVDVESFGLTEIQLKELRDFLKADCDDPGIFESELKAMLKDSAPGLLDQLLNDGDCVAMDAITSLRFAGDKPSLYVDDDEDEDDEDEDEEDKDEGDDEEGEEEGEEDADEDGDEDNDGEDEEEGDAEGDDEGDEADQGQDYKGIKTIQDASSRFCKLPAPKYPRLLRRKVLAEVASLPFMQCYLFSHLDEYGYAAPPAVSMATLGYFSGEYNARLIDMALLPEPIRQDTTYGRVMDKVISKLPVEKRLDYIVDIDFEGENAMLLIPVSKAAGYYCNRGKQACPFERTRQMFFEHAQKMRERIIGVLPNGAGELSEELIDAMVAHTMPMLA